MNKSKSRFNRLSLLGLIDSLESAVRRLNWHPKGTEWADYYTSTNYSSFALHQKKEIVAEFLNKIHPQVVWDLGANVGMFSRIASNIGIQTISFDIDPSAVEINYLELIGKDETNILPLLLDLTNPSPDIGWQNQERRSLMKRGPADTVLALALIHHLAISNNLPLNKIAEFFNKICSSLIIEFIPKSDSQVKRLLSTREDIFHDYTQHFFESEFREHFTILDSIKIKDSERTLYLMERMKV